MRFSINTIDYKENYFAKNSVVFSILVYFNYAFLMAITLSVVFNYNYNLSIETFFHKII